MEQFLLFSLINFAKRVAPHREGWDGLSQAPSPPCLQGLRLLSDKTAAAIGRFQGKCEETEILSSMGTAQPCEGRAAVGQAHVLAWRNTLQPTCCPAIAFAPLPWHLGPQCVVPTCPQYEEPKLHRPCPCAAPALTAPTPSADCHGSQMPQHCPLSWQAAPTAPSGLP